MRAFSCPSCRRLAPFESVLCLHCGAEHGVDWSTRELLALRPDGPGHTLEVVGDGGQRFRCANLEIAGCNGLVEQARPLCPACALTRTRPDDTDPAGLRNFAGVEAAKRRLVFELGELGLPVAARRAAEDGTEAGLAFDLLSSSVEPVTTGQADGVVTIDLAEADDAHREAVRVQMAEPYRTVLGHLRHEIGHYYEPLIVVADDDVAECRRLFGDDREDYAEAMDRHYASPTAPPGDWAERFVSSYATMHPWEDWAETFAHYLHIRDTLQTAGAYGVRVDGPEWVAAATSSTLRSAPRELDEDAGDAIQPILDAWLPLTYALNAINRSMGAEDLYPFVLTPAVTEKLQFVHRMVRAAAVSEPLDV